MSSSQPPPSLSSPLSLGTVSFSYDLTNDGITTTSKNKLSNVHVLHKMIHGENWRQLRNLFQTSLWKEHSSVMLCQQDHDGRTPLHIFCRMTDLFQAAAEEKNTWKKRTISEISNENNDDEYVENKNEDTTGEDSEYGNVNENKNNKNSLPMDVAKKLMNLESLFINDNGGENVLHGLGVSGYSKHVMLVKEILRFANRSSDGKGAWRLLSHQDRCGSTPLHLVCDDKANLGSIRVMLQYCTSCSSFSLSSNYTSTRQAQATTPPQHKTIVRSFEAEDESQKTKVAPEINSMPTPNISPHLLSLQDAEGDTCLHVACSGGGDVELLEELCRQWPEALFIQNKKQQLPVQRSIYFWRYEQLSFHPRTVLCILHDKYEEIVGLSSIHDNKDGGDVCVTREDHEDNSDESQIFDDDDDSHNYEDDIIPPLWDSVRVLLQAAFQFKHLDELSLSIADSTAIQQEVRPFHAAVAIKEFPREAYLLALVTCQNIQEEVTIFDPNTGMLPLHMATSLRMTTNSVKEQEDTLFKIKSLLHWYPEAATVVTQDNEEGETSGTNMNSIVGSSGRCRRLPLMLAVMNNHPMEHIKTLLEAAPHTIRCREGSGGKSSTMHFYPFMMAAVGSNNSLSVVYELLILDPTVLFSLL